MLQFSMLIGMEFCISPFCIERLAFFEVRGVPLDFLPMRHSIRLCNSRTCLLCKPLTIGRRLSISFKQTTRLLQ